jgi:hypothetical protein
MFGTQERARLNAGRFYPLIAQRTNALLIFPYLPAGFLG